MGVYTPPKIFYLNDKIYVSVTEKIYLFDSQAKSIANFPLSGASSIDIQDIENDKTLDIWITNHLFPAQMMQQYSEMDIEMDISGTDIELPNNLNVGEELADANVTINMNISGIKMEISVDQINRKVISKESWLLDKLFEEKAFLDQVFDAGQANEEQKERYYIVQDDELLGQSIGEPGELLGVDGAINYVDFVWNTKDYKGEILVKSYGVTDKGMEEFASYILNASIMGQHYEERMTELETKAYNHFYSNKDSTYFYYSKMHQLAIEEEDYITAINNLNDLCVAAGIHFDLNKIESSIDQLDKLIKESKSALDTLSDKGDAQKNYFLYNKGNFYYSLENYESAQQYFDAIITNISEKPDFTTFLSICYSFIAQMNSLQGKFKVADEYYQKNIRLYENHIPADLEGLYKVYNLYAQSLYSQKKYVDAKKYWSITFSHIEKNYTENNRNSIITTGLSLATLYKDIVQIDSAMYYFDAINKYRIKDDPLSDLFLSVQGEIQIAKHEFNEAMYSFEDALKVSSPSDQPSKIKQKQLLLGILSAKAKSLSVQKNNTDNQLSIEAVDLAIKTLDILKPTFKNYSDKLLLIEEAFPLLETGIETIYQTYLTEQNNILIDKAFHYSEKSKAVILLDALLGVRATKFAKIPEDLLDQEKGLKSQYTTLVKTIEKNHPDYYDLRFNTEVTTLSEIQKTLVPSELLISYFYGNEAIYAIAVDNASKQIHRIQLDASLENSIRQMHRMLADSKSNVAALGKISYQLYQTLIGPLITSEEKKKLIIIPDGLLNYIPFGALNTNKNGLSYLMESHVISYSNSATLYAQLEERDKKNGGLLAFAPMFSGEQIEVNPNRDKLLPLPHNKREVDQILKSFSGQSYLRSAPAESGVGELKRGEGFLSLARGFFYSGASSIASTLWKVNDASTANLMDAFYRNLSDGNNKDEALQKAKKSFLETNRQNGLSHPYYWSGFIISGNTAALTSPNYIMWVGIGIFVLLSIITGFFLFRRRQAS
ncbi:Tetratricopeptide repeat protein 28 [Nymphon striatum]|nr:Tetratricopeptide repeat protein 28 [Nymphon striatum]